MCLSLLCKYHSSRHWTQLKFFVHIVTQRLHIRSHCACMLYRGNRASLNGKVYSLKRTRRALHTAHANIGSTCCKSARANASKHGPDQGERASSFSSKSGAFWPTLTAALMLSRAARGRTVVSDWRAGLRACPAEKACTCMVSCVLLSSCG